jgi:hypothetical protein
VLAPKRASRPAKAALSARQQVTALALALHDSQETLSSARADNARLTSDAAAQVAHYEARLAATADERAKLTAALATLTTTNEALSASLAAEQATNAKLCAMLAATEAHAALLQAARDNADYAARHALAASTATIARLQATLGRAQATAQATEATMRRQAADLAASAASNEALTASLTNAHATNANLCSTLAITETALRQHAADLAAVTKKLRAADATITHLRADLCDAHATLALAHGAKAAALQAAASATFKLARAAAESKTAYAKCDSLHRCLQEATAKAPTQEAATQACEDGDFPILGTWGSRGVSDSAAGEVVVEEEWFEACEEFADAEEASPLAGGEVVVRVRLVSSKGGSKGGAMARLQDDCCVCCDV